MQIIFSVHNVNYDFVVFIYLIKYYKHPFYTYFYYDPFKLLYGFYDIRLDLANEFSIFNKFPSTFGPLLGYHQRVSIVQKYNTTFYLYWCNFFFFLLMAQEDFKSTLVPVEYGKLISEFQSDIHMVI